MKFNETVAYKCRYGEEAEKIFIDADILAEKSEDDYQGSVFLIAAMPDGKIAYFSYWYGSCSGCDDWESRELTSEEIVQDMRNECLELFTPEEFEKYYQMFAMIDELATPSIREKIRKMQKEGK